MMPKGSPSVVGTAVNTVIMLAFPSPKGMDCASSKNNFGTVGQITA
jgi:hypothetical protein